jgi:GxxExxY protein
MKYSTKRELDKLTYEIIGAGIDVHRSFGGGLLESFYHDCTKIALEARNIPFKTEMIVPVEFMGKLITTSLRCDLFVDDAIVVELKSVQEVAPIHEAQLMTYMKLLRSPKGILINFNCPHLFREG